VAVAIVTVEVVSRIVLSWVYDLRKISLSSYLLGSSLVEFILLLLLLNWLVCWILWQFIQTSTWSSKDLRLAESLGSILITTNGLVLSLIIIHTSSHLILCIFCNQFWCVFALVSSILIIFLSWRWPLMSSKLLVQFLTSKLLCTILRYLNVLTFIWSVCTIVS